MADLDRLLSADISHAAEEAVEPPDFAPVEHRAAQRRRTRTILTATAVTVVIALVAAGGSLLVDHVNTSTPPTSPGHSSPTFGAMPSGDGAKSQTIEPGSYRVSSSAWSALDYTIAFPAGWTVQYGHIYHQAPEGELLTVEPAVVDEIYTDACRTGGVPEAVGPRAQDLVTALRKQPGPVTGRPVQTTLGGYPATRLDLRIPTGLDLKSCRLANDNVRGLQIWYSAPTDNYFVLLPGAVASVYILDVGGQRQVFVAQNRAPNSPETRAELQRVLDSIRIES
jgi:hypothetical protein